MVGHLYVDDNELQFAASDDEPPDFDAAWLGDVLSVTQHITRRKWHSCNIVHIKREHKLSINALHLTPIVDVDSQRFLLSQRIVIAAQCVMESRFRRTRVDYPFMGCHLLRVVTYYTIRVAKTFVACCLRRVVERTV